MAPDDNGGVHINPGIPQPCLLYLAATGLVALPGEKVGKIYFYTLLPWTDTVISVAAAKMTHQIALQRNSAPTARNKTRSRQPGKPVGIPVW